MENRNLDVAVNTKMIISEARNYFFLGKIFKNQDASSKMQRLINKKVWYPPGESLQLIIAQSMGKAVTFNTPQTPCSRRTVTDLVISETLYHE